jgi:hypothetical protein
MVTPLCSGEILAHWGQQVMLVTTCLSHPPRLSLSWSCDIIRHIQTMIGPCTLMSCLHLTRQALVYFRWPNSPSLCGHQHLKTKPPYGLSPDSPPCPTRLLFFHKIFRPCAFSGGMLAMYVAAGNETLSCAHLPKFSPKGAHCHCSPESPWANTTSSIPPEPH